MSYKPGSDKVLLYTVCILTFLGIVMVYSASSVHATAKHGESSYVFFLRQLIIAGIGFAALWVFMHVDYHFFLKPRVIKAGIVLTAAALFFVFKQDPVNGAHRWIRFGGGISVQPSEFAKLAVLIFIAWFIHRYEKEINRPEHFFKICLLTAFFAILIGHEPDYGQAFTLCLIVAILLLMAGLAWRYIAGAVLFALTFGPLLFYYLVYKVDYRWKRVMVFLNPENDPTGDGWQISQSFIAIGSGGFRGLGPGDSKQKLFFLSESSTDFIFAIICEELGLIGAALIVAAFMIIFYRGMRIALKSNDRFGFYLGAGITLMITLQAFINISMVLGMLPTTGIALPFISLGGSSLLMNLAATGILLNLSYQNKRTEAE